MPDLSAEDRTQLCGQLAGLIDQAASLAALLGLDLAARQLEDALGAVRGRRPSTPSIRPRGANGIVVDAAAPR